jgi:outer membrane immunogenic protein
VDPGGCSAAAPTVGGVPFTGGGTSFNNSNNGWTAGGGFEWAIFHNWTARLEYLHMQFPNVSTNFTTTTSAGGPLPFATTATTHISSNVGVGVVRFGVNYLFNFGGPAYAY